MPATREGYNRSDVYDAIYTKMKSYHEEAGRVVTILRQFMPGRSYADMTLLDVACGTGLHLQWFAQWFKSVEGVDLSTEQLAAAERRLPNVPLYEGNMLSLMLADVATDLEAPEPTFDVVTCLFSAIGHMQDVQQLRRSIHAMADHLNPGGVLLVEPWLTRDSWTPGHISIDVVDDPNFKVSRITRSTLDGRLTTLEMHHTVGTPDGIEYYIEEHRVALFTQEEYEEAFRRAGLEVTFDPKGISKNGRGIYIGVKPS